jgi:hypothetical protein
METTNTGKSIYELVRCGEFVEGYAYTSEKKGDFTIAISLTGLTRSGVSKISHLVQIEIDETKARLAGTSNELLTKIYKAELVDLDKSLKAIERATKI